MRPGFAARNALEGPPGNFLTLCAGLSPGALQVSRTAYWSAIIRFCLERRNENMTYVVTEDCIKCKYMDCVEVCPVDCFYEGNNMLVIHPDECIDCGVCEPECPPKAILPDSDAKAERWLKMNADLSVKWPNITRKGTPPPDADAHKDEPGKFDKYFDAEPGKGE